MVQNKNHNIFTWMQIVYTVILSRFLTTDRFKCIDSKELYLNKYNKNNSKGGLLEVRLKYPKEQRKLHNDYSLAADKTEIKEEMLP